jgi:plasmid stabilization system protein ParE
MLYEVAFSEEAQAQLHELEEYLSERFYPGDAEKYVQRLVDACASLAAAPYRGTRREDLGEGIRSTGFERRATIYFRVLERQVVILGIFYGGRSPRLGL